MEKKEQHEFSRIGSFLHFTVAPLLLITLAPPFILLLTYLMFHLDSSFTALLHQLTTKNLYTLLHEEYGSTIYGTSNAWKIIGIFSLLQLILMKFPGKPYEAPMHTSGHIPRYVDNGLYAYLITCVVFFTCTYGLGLFSPTLLFDNFEELFTTLNLFGLLLCLFLYIKGRTFPSSSEHGASGNIIFDYYWGTDLYPRIFGWDVKVFTNSRFGLMFWQMMIFSCMAKQYATEGYIADSMWVCGILQTQYLLKFYLWEEGYFKSTDIVVDRAGFYICWGCLSFLFVIWNIPHVFLVSHPIQLGTPLAATMIIVGIFFTWLTYWIDQQKVIVRSTQGKCLVFGKKPELIIAKYKTASGKEKASILLCSGFWGFSRQFHFLPELIAGLLWSLPAKFTHTLPYSYIIILLAIIVQRSFRDEWKCSEKYGKYWKQYCEKVPYRIIPYIL